MSIHTNQVDLVPNQGWDPRILVCRNGRLVDTFIVVTQRFVILVDTLINETTAAVLLEMARPHLVEGRTLLVVNTHADYDHAWGNQLFAGPGARFPAPILASQACAERLRHPDAVATLRQRQAREPEIFGPVILTPPTLVFPDSLTVDGGDLTLQLFPTPGHTPDHISVYIPEIGTLLAGDAAEWPYPMAGDAAGLAPMRRSIQALLDRQPERVLYCHAPVTMGRRLLQLNRAYFDALEQHCRAALARGVPPDPPEAADVIDLVGLPFAQALPAGTDISDVPTYYQQAGHAGQLRMMLATLAAADGDRNGRRRHS